jgi:FkbM family methyltransferase
MTSLKNLVLKKITIFFGNLPFFKGQDRIVRFLYPPHKYKNLDKGEKFLVNYFGVKYKGITSNYIDWGVYFKGGHEKSLVNYFKNKISKFDYFFDIGANSGTISLPFIFEDNLKIICFEPLKYSFNKLEKNFEVNNAPSRHQLHRLAISNHKGNTKIHFSKTNENPGFASIDNYFKHQNLSTEEVELNTINNLFKIKNKNLIFKIDVEGYEKKVIEGALEILKNNKVLMYLESRDEKTIDNLKEIGFKEKYIKFKGDKIQFLKNKKSQDILLQNF